MRKHPVFNYLNCVSCSICTQACPVSALDMKKEGKSGKYRNVFPEPNNRTCTGCGICAKACPMEAITMVEVEEK